MENSNSCEYQPFDEKNAKAYKAGESLGRKLAQGDIEGFVTGWNNNQAINKLLGGVKIATNSEITFPGGTSAGSLIAGLSCADHGDIHLIDLNLKKHPDDLYHMDSVVVDFSAEENVNGAIADLQNGVSLSQVNAHFADVPPNESRAIVEDFNRRKANYSLSNYAAVYTADQHVRIERTQSG